MLHRDVGVPDDVIATFERADAVDKNSKSGAKEGAGDGALELHEFCEALVILAFGTANPKYEEAADADKDAAVVEPLPACFQSLLEKKILTNAKRDELAKTKTYIEKDRVVLKKIRPRRDACRELFEKECAEDTSVPKGPVPKMGMDKFTQSLFDKKIISDLKVSPTPQVAGEAVPEFHVCLTMADAKQAFVAMGTGDVDGETLTFDDFMVALCLCATFKYAEVKVPTDDDPEAGMALEKMCEAICFNYTGEKDEAKAITDALYPPLVRFDPEGSRTRASSSSGSRCTSRRSTASRCGRRASSWHCSLPSASSSPSSRSTPSRAAKRARRLRWSRRS